MGPPDLCHVVKFNPKAQGKEVNVHHSDTRAHVYVVELGNELVWLVSLCSGYRHKVIFTTKKESTFKKKITCFEWDCPKGTPELMNVWNANNSSSATVAAYLNSLTYSLVTIALF